MICGINSEKLIDLFGSLTIKDAKLPMHTQVAAFAVGIHVLATFFHTGKFVHLFSGLCFMHLERVDDGELQYYFTSVGPDSSVHHWDCALRVINI